MFCLQYLLRRIFDHGEMALLNEGPEGKYHNVVLYRNSGPGRFRSAAVLFLAGAVSVGGLPFLTLYSPIFLTFICRAQIVFDSWRRDRDLPVITSSSTTSTCHPQTLQHRRS